MFLVWQSSNYLVDSNEHALIQRARETTTLFATLVKDAVIATDVATLEAMVEQVAAIPEVTYVRIRDQQGVLAEQGHVSALAKPFALDIDLKSATDGVFDSAATIDNAGYAFGTVELGLSTAKLSMLINHAHVRLFMIATMELAVVALVSWLLGLYLTRLLTQLQKAANGLAQGDLDVRIPVKGRDELASTARAFNEMARQLAAEQSNLQQSLSLSNELSEKFANSEVYLRTVLESVSDGIITIGLSGVIQRVNPAAERLFGYPSGTLRGDSFGKLLSDPFKTYYLNKLEQFDPDIHSEWVTEARECLGLKQGGSKFPMDLSIAVMNVEGEYHFVGLVRDLTDHWRLRAEAERNETLKSAISDASLDALVTINMEGSVVEYSPAAERIFGWPRAHMIGRPMADFLIPEELRKAHHKGMEQFQMHGVGKLVGHRTETEALRRSGERFPIELSLIATEVNGVRLATASIRDISERKANERALREAKDQAERASQAKSRFLSHMSHEIRSPLNAVLGALNLLGEQINTDEQKRLMNIASSSGSALLHVINDVLDFSKIEAGHMQFEQHEFKLEPILRSVLDAADTRSSKPALDLYFQVDSMLQGPLQGDSVRLRQIVNIFVDNALKYTERGVIAVLVSPVSMKTGEQGLEIKVCDTGPGIEPKLQHSIFEEFEQVDAARDTGYGGTGLGLTIARNLVEAMGGAVGLDSVVGEGSCFHFSLPVKAVASAIPAVNLQGSPVVLITPNLPLQGMIEPRVKECNGAFIGFSSLEAFQGAVGSAWGHSLESLNLLIDEPVLAELNSGKPADNAMLQWLDSLPGRKARLIHCPATALLPAMLNREMAIIKPLAAEQIVQFCAQGSVIESESGYETAVAQCEGRVLLVEDVEVNRLIAAEMLLRRGFTVDLAIDGMDAIKKASQAPYDIILMDVRMPRLNGIEAARKIRSEVALNHNTPIIALTANAEKSEIQRCKQAGMNEFVSKPFEVDYLVSLMTRLQQNSQTNTTLVTEPVEVVMTILSQPVIDRLIKDTSAEALPAMLTMFTTEVSRRLGQIKVGLANTDSSLLREEAHALKSCAGTFGAIRLQGSAKALENQAASGQVEAYPRLVAALSADVEETLAAYGRYKDELVS